MNTEIDAGRQHAAKMMRLGMVPEVADSVSTTGWPAEMNRTF